MRKDSFTEAMDIFDAVFNSALFPSFAFTQDDRKYSCPTFPPVNIYIDEEKKDLQFELALAGVDPAAVSLSFAGDFMELKVKKDETEKSTTKKMVVYGIKKVSLDNNRYYVPADKYDTSNTKAEFKNGILTILVPAREELAVKPIEIKIV